MDSFSPTQKGEGYHGVSVKSEMCAFIYESALQLDRDVSAPKSFNVVYDYCNSILVL